MLCSLSTLNQDASSKPLVSDLTGLVQSCLKNARVCYINYTTSRGGSVSMFVLFALLFGLLNSVLKGLRLSAIGKIQKTRGWDWSGTGGVLISLIISSLGLRPVKLAP
ncbi:hypothetical protein KCU70_g109, partial [Aureobasidium melanogenum]